VEVVELASGGERFTSSGTPGGMFNLGRRSGRSAPARKQPPRRPPRYARRSPKATIYLASGDAGFVNGIALPIEGGATAGGWATPPCLSGLCVCWLQDRWPTDLGELYSSLLRPIRPVGRAWV